jgi:hypothetical protein
MKMKQCFFPVLLAGMVCSCVPEQADDEGADAGASGAPVAAPTEDVLAQLKGQKIGGQLLGNTVMLSDGEFVAADLAKAPDYYLVYYSASW